MTETYTQVHEDRVVRVTVYNVQERMPDGFTDDEEWYEYECFLMKEDGSIVDSWDSLFETYNGVKGQRLSEKKATQSAKEVRDNPTDWFSSLE